MAAWGRGSGELLFRGCCGFAKMKVFWGCLAQQCVCS